MKRSLLLILPIVLLLSACTTTPTTQTEPTMNTAVSATSMPAATTASNTSETISQKDVVDIAIGSKDHTTLVSAVTAAGLVETLKGTGPFTVFAPTNSAFAALPAGTVEGLLKPEKKADLTNVLTYHVVPGKYMASDIKEGLKLKTVQGQEITFTMKNGAWYINGTAKISAADLSGSNGVVHVIDSVILPK